MIQSFADADTKQLFEARSNKRWQAISAVALRKLDMIEAAAKLDDLRVPPGNRLESLKDDRKGQHSIRINDQFRVCFVWIINGPKNVAIVDYH